MNGGGVGSRGRPFDDGGGGGGGMLVVVTRAANLPPPTHAKEMTREPVTSASKNDICVP